jgi:hypothetical protein
MERERVAGDLSKIWQIASTSVYSSAYGRHPVMGLLFRPAAGLLGGERLTAPDADTIPGPRT